MSWYLIAEDGRDIWQWRSWYLIAGRHICTHLHTSVHICTRSVHICLHLYTSVHICTHLYTPCTHVYTCIQIYTHMYTPCTHLYTSVHTCRYLYTTVHMCTHLYLTICTSSFYSLPPPPCLRGRINDGDGEMKHKSPHQRNYCREQYAFLWEGDRDFCQVSHSPRNLVSATATVLPGINTCARMWC